MKFERVTDSSHPMYVAALNLYQISFPNHEQREAISQEKILQDEDYHFTLIYDDEVFVGLILYWEWKDAVYIEHFCILPEKRNHQYGQKALALLSEIGKPLILEIDPPIDNITVRRKGFYERCGFVENSFSHIHPPYHRSNKGHELMIMSYPRQITKDEYYVFYSNLTNQVMDHVFE